jgi:hypothetical protein
MGVAGGVVAGVAARGSAADGAQPRVPTSAVDPSRLLAQVVSDCGVARALCPRAAEPLAVLAAAREQQRDLAAAISAYEELLFLEPPVSPRVSSLAFLKEVHISANANKIIQPRGK